MPETKTMTVKTKEGESWDFSVDMPTSLDEAIERTDEQSVFETYLGGFSVRIQNRARDLFRKGKTREEVEAYLASYKPGETKTSKVERATKAIVSNGELLASDSDLAQAVTAAFVDKDYDEVLRLIEDAAGEIED